MTTTMTDEQLARVVITESDAERLRNGSSVLQDEFTSAKTLFHFAQAIRNGSAKILRK